MFANNVRVCHRCHMFRRCEAIIAQQNFIHNCKFTAHEVAIYQMCVHTGVLCSQHLRLHFKKFDLEYGSSRCPFDKLQVYDDYGSKGTLRGTYCGTKRPADIISKRRGMFVKFTTDRTTTKSGFLIDYSVGRTIF